MSTKPKTEEPAFGKLRSFLWPIHNYELKKLLPMLFLFFCILFNYTVLRDTKDTLIMTAPKSGAEAIPFLKVYGVLPFAILFMVIYSKLSNKLSKKKLFYTAVTPFIVFFTLFSTVIYPNRAMLHPTDFCDMLQANLPAGFMGLISILRNWTYSLFYIMAELWGSVCLSLLFWGFANDITKVSESKRFYSLFGLGANFSLILAGAFITWASNSNRAAGTTYTDSWQVSLYWLTSAVAFSGVLVMAIYWWINKYVMTDPRFYDMNAQKKMKKDKPKLSMMQSIKFLAKSKYIGLIAVLVISYGMCINLIEVTWKSQLKLAYPDPNSYSAFMGGYSRNMGIVTIFMMLFVGGNSIRRLGWKFSALLTPAIILITGGLFFTFMLFNDSLAGTIAAFGTSPLALAVLFGTIQNILSKSAKYSLFDPTKEMTYIPLDQESKVKGKAAIDVVGARLGKSGGALMQQFMIISLGSIAAMAPYICGIILLLVGAWSLSVVKLSGLFKKAMSDLEAADQEPAVSASASAEETPSANAANSSSEEPAKA
ncbi:MAG: ADP,ATP carrier protein 1 [Chlamydiia bacterium]|nr:ADP,ATP carrier protein 1 [Chlamydiia bacterium]